MRKIAVATGTRAESGLLHWLLKELLEDREFELQLVVTGTHLAPAFGMTVRTLVDEGFPIAAEIPMPVDDDSSHGVTTAMGVGVIGFGDAFARLQPDLLVVLGDRYEMLAAVQAALIAKIPVAHIAGGDTTEGAFDEAIRHSITKMSHLHFVTNDVSGRRVAQMGEDPARIFNVGHLGLDAITRTQLLDRAQWQADVGFELQAMNLLITFHPVTLDHDSPAMQFQQLLDALELLVAAHPNVGMIFTRPNADPGSRELFAMIDAFVARHAHAKAFTSLGQLRYLSAMAHVDAVVGNSSSGIYEAPAMHKPTVNIGDRQRGRLQAASVIDCVPESKAICAAIEKAFAMDCQHVKHPYGGGDASAQIVAKLKAFADYRSLLKKHFYDFDGGVLP